MLATIISKFRFAIIFGLTACSLTGVTLHLVGAAQRDGHVTEVFLNAGDTRPSGPCPFVVTFGGSIRTDGPVTVKYTFTRSDGATGPVFALEFKEAGTQSVSTTWTLGDAKTLPSYEGWQAIRILSPNELESNHESGKFSLSCATAGNGSSFTRPNPTGNGTAAQQPDQISPEVSAALQQFEQDSAARAAARQQRLDVERARFEPAANALVEAVRGSGVDLENYLAASKQFVETPVEKLSQSEVNRVNQTYGEPIRAAIARAVGLPGVGDFMQTPMSGPLGLAAPGQPNPNDPNGSDGAGGQLPSCSCETRRFEPPFDGLASEGDFGTRSIRPGPVRQLFATVRSAVLAAPHSRKGSGRAFTVPASARRVSVTVNLASSWNIGLSGLGYAHVWLGLDMNVTNSGTAVCSAAHLEQDNLWTWAGGILTLSSRPPVPSFTRTCTFERRPGDPTAYAANIFASTDGTFFGASGGFGEYKVDLGRVDVTYCP